MMLFPTGLALSIHLCHSDRKQAIAVLGSTLGIVAAVLFLQALERRRAAKAYRRAMELLHPVYKPEPVEMYFAEPVEPTPIPRDTRVPLSFADKTLYFLVAPYFAVMAVLWLLYAH